MKHISPRKLRARFVARPHRPGKLRPLGISLARFSSALAVCGALLAGVHSGQAAKLSWDPDGDATNNNAATQIGLGGSGTWDLSSTRWWDPTLPLNADQIWPNTILDTAVFGGALAPSAVSTVTLGAPVSAAGLTFTTSGYSLVHSSTFTLTLAASATPVIAGFGASTIGTQSIAGIAGTQGFIKTGGGALTVQGQNTGLSGPIILAGGTLTSTNGNQSDLQTTSLGTGDIQLNTGTLSLLNNGTGSNLVAPIAYSNNLIINGNSALVVNNAGGNNNNAISVASLNLNNSQLTVSNGNNYGFVVAGTTTLNGPLSTLNTGMTQFQGAQTDPNVGLLALIGQVTGAGALNKAGSGTVTLKNATNNYSGGTNILGGGILLNTANASLGTGNVIVNAGANLGVTTATNLTLSSGKTLALASAPNSLAVLRVDANNNVITGTAAANMFISPYGASFQINGNTSYSATGDILAGTIAGSSYSQNIDLSTIGSSAAGNGKIIFGATNLTNNQNAIYTGILTSASDNIFRLGAGGSATTGQLVIAATNALNDNRAAGAQVVIGSPINNIQTITNGTQTVQVTATQNFTGAITINKGSTLSVPNTTVQNPLGMSPINILGGTLDTTASNYTGSGSQLGNNPINLYQGGTLALNNSAVTLAGGTGDLRLNSASTLGFNSGTLTFTGSNTANTTTTQGFEVVNAAGGNIVNITTSSTAANNSDAGLTFFDFNRVGAGTVAFARPGTTQPANFGLNTGNTDSRVTIGNLNGAPPAPGVTASLNGMLAPYLVDETSKTFLTYGANGIATVTYDDTNFASPAANKIEDVTATAAPGNVSVYALRIGGLAGAAFGLTGTNTITIVGNPAGGNTDGAGLLLNTITAAQTNTPNFTFGTSGSKEAIIYATGGQNNTLSGAIAATGLTKFGPSALLLTGTNFGLTGTITVNQGTLNGTAAALNFRPVTLNAGTLQINNAASLFLNDLTVIGDSTLDTGTNLQQRIQSITVAARTGALDPVTFTIIAGGAVVNGTTTLNGPVNLVATAGGNQNIFGNPLLGSAALTGTGALNKWGSGQVVLASSSPTYSGAITVNGVGGNNNNNLLRSQAAAASDRPFGIGNAITVNPGGVLSLAHPNNTLQSTVTLNSDLNGLATIVMNYNGAAATPTVTAFNNGNLGGPFSAVLSVDAVGVSGNIDLNTFGGGRAFLGSSNQTGNYTGNLTASTVGLANSLPGTGLGSPYVTPTSTGVYRIGAGGGTTQFFGGPGQFAAGNDIQVGAINNVHQFTSISLGNGNGTAAIYNVNATFNGKIVLNGSTNTLGQGNLLVGNNNSLGTGTIIFNGGGIQADTSTGIPFNNSIRTLSNPIVFAGDALFNGSTDLKLTANIGLADGQTGVTRTFNVANTGGLTIFSGSISDGSGGAATNSITKTGSGPLVFTGSTTYSGYTNLNAGTIVVASDTDISSNSQIILGGGALGVWNASFTTDRNYIITGTSNFDIGAAKTLTQSINSNISGTGSFPQKLGLGTLVLNGINSNSNSTASWNILNGILAVSSNVNLGDPVGNSTVFPQGGTFRALDSFTTPRSFNTNNTGNGGIDVVPTKTLTITGVVTSTAGFIPTKTGLGTVVSTGTNTNVGLTTEAGTWQAGNSQPFATTAALNFNGGTFAFQNTGAAAASQTVATSGNATFGGGGHILLQHQGTGFSTQFSTTGAFARIAVGTLVIDALSPLGVAGNDAVRFIPTNLHGVARASAVTNGIFAPNIITANSLGVANFLVNDATNGLKPWDFATPAAVTTLSGLQPTAIGNITTPQTITGTDNRIYAFRTNSDVLAGAGGGTLKVVSINGTTNEGGILVNASVNFGANLIFDPTATAGGSATSGEGLLYVAPGATATLNGNVSATSFTKFGTGTVVFAGANNGILGALTIQEGTLQVAPGTNFAKLQTDLVLNNQGTLDLNGGRLRFSSLANSTGVTGGIAGGIIGNSSTTADAVFSVFSTVNSTFAGRILDGLGGSLRTTALVKNGTATLTLAPFTVNNPDANVNTFTGGTTVNQGSLVVQDPRALGTGAINLVGGTLNLQSNGGGINGTIILGDQTGIGSTVNVRGPVTINVDRPGANSGNSWQIGALNLTENSLTVTGGNSYHLRVNGPTTILGNYATLTTGSTSSNGTMEIVGQITGSGALNKFGADVSRMLLVNNPTNSYSGGTNIQSGRLVVNATSGTPLGSGRINVFPTGMLSLTGLDTPANGWTAGTIGGAPVRVHGYFNSLGFIGLDNDDFDPTPLLNAPNVLNNAYGTIGIALTRPFYTRTLDQSAIGDGKTFLTGGLFTDVSYIAPTLAPGLGDGIAPRVYRLAGGPTTLNLVFPGADNVLNDTSAAGTSVHIGSPTSVVVGAGVPGTVGSALNFVILRNSNNYTGGTIVWKGSGLQIETGASPVGTSNSPLGSGPVDVWGILQTSGQNGSFVDGTSGGPVVNRNAIILHPGGQITINDVAGNVTGGQGRWADGTGINLNGGTFQFNGANGYASIETIGTVTVDKGSRIIVNRTANAGTAALVVNDLVRTTASGSPGNGNGTLLIGSQAAGSLGIPASTTVTNVAAGSYDRLIVSNPTSAAIALVGKTSIGAGVTAGIAAAGVAPAWIINTTDNTFVTYSPVTGTNSGYQGLVSAGSAGASAVAANGTFTPGANQVGYSKVITTGLEGGANPIQLVAGDTVDMTTTALTLGDNPTIHALRTAVNISASGTNNTLTITGGGLIGVTNLTIGVAPTTGVGNMTLNFGTGGSAEGLIYQVNNTTTTINAQIGASALTLFSTRGANDVAIALTASNPNLTGPVTINQGRVNLANTLSGLGTPVAGMLNNQNVYIGGAGPTNASNGAIRLLLTGTVGTASTSILPSGVNSTTLFGTGTWFINGDAQVDNNSNAYLQRLNNLTFPDLGAGKPIELTNTGLSIVGTTTLGSATSTTFLNTTFGNPGGSVFGGLVTGGRLVKYGNGALLLSGTANNYASTVINQAGVNTATSIVGSLTRTGAPFGSGSITVNPGGQLRVMAPGNISGNAVTLKSDGLALAGIGISANITPAALATLIGSLTMTSTGDFGGVVSLDSNSWNSALSLTALDAASNSGKHLWLGSSMNPTQTYFNSGYLNYNAATITAASDNVIRIGGGGNQGAIAVGVGQFENVLSGNADLQIGAVTAGINANGPMYINGNIGQLLLNTRNLAFTGTVEVNVGGQLTIGNANALANASAINMEGGNLGITNIQTLKTPINVVGDTFGYVGGSAFDNTILAGAINLAPSGAGGTRTFNFNAAGTGITGIISGGPGSNIIRIGGASVIFHANNTYQGTTTINSELLFAGTDVAPLQDGAFGNSDTPILLGNAGGTTAGKAGIAGQFTFGRGFIATGASGNQFNLIRSQALQTAVITGGINTQSATIGGGLAIDAISTAGGVGGVLDLQGPISGAGAIQIGGGGQGIVRFSASVNGLGINTYTGSTNIWGGRVQVNADTYFTGLASAPIVISGPFGTGALYLGRQGTTTGGVANQAPTFVQIDAFGADRTIVNTLGSINQNGDTTINFGAHNNLTFTSGMDINSDGTLRIRTFNVLTSQGAVTFSGALSASGAAFARITKTGAGTLVLTGANTINYAAAGNPLAVNAGVLQFNTDTNLGAVSTTAHTINLGGGTLQPAAAGTVLWAAASSNRALNLTANSFTNVSDPAGIFQLDTAVTGAFGLTKLGAGTLKLNASTNAFTNLTIGGFPIGGGTVSTTAATGTPFGTAASTITLNSGVLSLIGGASAQAITTANLEFRGGAYVQLNKGTTGSQLTATTLTRGTTVPGGTLTLLPSVIATLGSGAAATSENVIAGNAATVFPNNTGGDTLAIPVVQTRLAGAARPASFVKYGTNGFQLSTNANTGVLTANNPTLVASVPGGTVGTGSNLSVLGLITTGSIGQTDASPLYIANGGLIINGTSGAQITANLVFGDVARAATAASGANTFTLGAGTNADLQVGELVTGPGILPGTTIATLPSYPTGNTFTTNFNTTAAVTTLNTVKEALVYVQDGQSTVSSIGSGGATPSGFTAANFTKSGPGTLLIGGSTNVMAPFNSGVGLRVLQINEGAVQFAGQSSLPSGGLIFVNPMDTGTLDLNGQSLSIAGLGVGTSVAGPGTGNVTSSTGATLTLNGSNLATQFNGVIGGNISLVKSGTGTQILGASSQTGLGGNTFTGGTTINAGNITSATGLFTPLGTLQVKGVNSLGTGAITLAGGILEFNNAIVGSDVYTNVVAVLQGGNNGYDVTVPALNNLGSPNTTSQFATNSTVNFQAINSLTVNAPVLTFAGGSGNGVLVKGTTTFNQDTVLNVTGTGQAVFAGTLSAPGKTLTKIGTTAMFLTGTGGDANGTGGAANNVGAWNILAGTVEVRMSDGGSNPLGSGTTITLNSGTLNLRHDGDNLGDPQTLTTFNTNTLVIGSLVPVSSANYIDSLNSVLSTDRLNGGSNKTNQLAQLQFGGPLGAAFLSHNAGNNQTVEVTGGLTMIKDAYLAINSTPFTIDTQLSGNGTLYKQGGAELAINTVATNTGGTVLASGTTSFASFQGNTRTLNSTAKLSAGGITLQPGALIRFNGTGNINGGQVVDLRSNLANYAVIGIGEDSLISAFNLRVPQAAGAFSNNLVTALNTGAGVLAINALYSKAINLNTIGDGGFFLGSNNSGAGIDSTTSVNGTITGTVTPSLVKYNFGPANSNNSNAVYRLGGGGAFLNIGLLGAGTSPLADSSATVKSSVVVGGPLTNSSNTAGGATIGNATGTVFLNTPQTYTGNTLVNRNSTLEVRAAMATSGYEAFGTLAAGGNGGTFATGPIPVIRPGGTLRLDNSLDLLPVGATQGRWGDSTAVNLDSSTFQLTGNAAADLTEVVGTINVAGGSTLTPRTMFAGRIAEINASSIVRTINNNSVTGNNGQLSIQPVNGTQLGTNERVTATTIANYAGAQVTPTSAVQNGMVVPWMVNVSENQFLTYSDFGFVNAGFNLVNVGGTLGATTGTGTERLLIGTATATLPVGGALNVWALRPDTGINLATVTDNTATVTIGSGGIVDSQSVSITPKVVFGSIGTPTDALISVNGNTLTIGDVANRTTSGQIVATNIAKIGAGTLSIDSTQPGFTGHIAINGGTVQLRDNQSAAGPITSQIAGSGAVGVQNIIFNGFNATLNLRSDVNGVLNFNQNLVISAGNPQATISVDRIAANSTIFTFLGGLNFGGAPGDQGQTLSVQNGNNTSLYIAGQTTLGTTPGNYYFNLTNANSNNINTTLAGLVTGPGTLVREGSSTGFLVLAPGPNLNPTASNTFTGGIVMNGNLLANATAAANSNVNFNTLGANNNVNIISGQLNLRVDQTVGATVETATFNNNSITMTGNGTINVDRVGVVASTNKLIAVNQLNIGGQTLTVSSSNTYGLQFNNVALTSTPTFNNSADLIVKGVTDSGAGLFVVKNGTGSLWFADSSNTYSGGTFINQGNVRFGTPLAVSATAKTGPGALILNPGAGIILESITNLNSGQQIDVRSIPNSLGAFRTQSILTQAQLQSVLTGTSTGLLVAGVAYTSPLDLASIGDGTFQFANAGDFTYTPTTLGAGAGNLYRLGGNGQNFRITVGNNNVLTDVTVATLGRTVVGPARLQVGSLASNGGAFVFNNTNNYTGGTSIIRGAQANFSTGLTNTPLGSGSVDVFGTLRVDGTSGTFLNAGSSANNNAVVLHPGATLQLGETTTNNNDRWHDGTGIDLNGATLFYGGGSTGTETVGAITFARGSRITVNNGTNPKATLTQGSGSPTRVGAGTLAFNADDASFGTNGTNTDNFVFTGAAPATANGMLPAYIVNARDNTYMTVSGQFFLNATDTLTIGANFNTGLTAGTDRVLTNANTTLTDNPVIYALRTPNNISNAPGQFNTITLSGSGTGGGLLLTGNGQIIAPNVKFGPNGEFEAPIYVASGVTSNFTGDISATGITKFGTGILQINKDQSTAARGVIGAVNQGFASGWVINEGQVTANVFGALGDAVAGNAVTLNGSTAGAAVLRLQANQANTSLAYYSMGDLNVVDNGNISYDPAADDRTQALGAAGALSNVVMTSTGGSSLDAQLLFGTNRSRTILTAGDLIVSGTNAGALLNIGQSAQTNFLTSGSSSGFSVASLKGTADQRIDKWGNAILYVRGASTFAGAVNIEQGVIQIANPAGLGDASATNIVTVKRFGTLDLNTAGFNRTDLIFQSGSILRLTADNALTGAALTAGGLNLGGGTLQVANDQTQTTTTAITMNGGSIEGFLRTDDLVGTNQAVYRTLGSNVTFNFAGNSFVGQNITQGVNGLDNGRPPTVFSPLGNTASGVLLEIKGVISGPGSLTKQGYDTVTLSGANAYTGGTNVVQGMLRIGATDSLPTSGNVSTTGAAVLDLNGFNQTVGRLTSPTTGATAATTNLNGSGFVTNTATTTNVLTVGASTDAIYSGVIQYNVALTKNGTNVQTLTNFNTYTGPTTVTGGVLEVSGSVSGTTKVDINGGSLAGAESTLAPGTTALAGGPVNVNNGGTFSPGAAGATAGVGNIGTFNAGGGLSLTGGGTLKIDLQSPYVSSLNPGVNDRANVTGTISLTGTNTLSLNLVSYTPTDGDLFFIALNDGNEAISGTAAALGTTFDGFYDVVVAPNGQRYAVSLTGDQATGAFTSALGNDIALLAIPEPGSWAMLLASFGATLSLHRFRRRRRV